MQITDFHTRHSFLVWARASSFKPLRYLSDKFRRLLIPSPSGETLIRTLEGHLLHINPAIDRGVEQDLYNYGTYEQGILDFMSAFLRKGDTFVDVGANIGLMSIHAARLVAPGGKVYSFEANPDTVPLLRKNLAANKIELAEVLPFALGSQAGTGKIYSNWHINRGGASLIAPTKDSPFHEISIRRFDEFWSTQKSTSIRLMKADVEGFELEVLRGFGTLLSAADAPALILECSEQRDNFNSGTADLFDYIRQINSYRIFRLEKGKEVPSRLLEVKDPSQLPSHDNIICLTPQHINSIAATSFHS